MPSALAHGPRPMPRGLRTKRYDRRKIAVPRYLEAHQDSELHLTYHERTSIHPWDNNFITKDLEPTYHFSQKLRHVEARHSLRRRTKSKAAIGHGFVQQHVFVKFSEMSHGN